MNLADQIDPIINHVAADFGGGSPRHKLLLMSHLAWKFRLKTYVEIGVYRGRSLFPLAYVLKQNSGMAYGVDPYSRESAYEVDVDPALRQAISDFIDQTDYDDIYQNVQQLRTKLGLVTHCEILRETSQNAVRFFAENQISVDMLHIDGNHDTRFVLSDVTSYMPLIAPNGFMIMDDTDWASVRPAFELALSRTALVLEAKGFAIFMKCPLDLELEKLRLEVLDLYQTFLTEDASR
jgi:hypothetical protein